MAMHFYFDLAKLVRAGIIERPVVPVLPTPPNEREWMQSIREKSSRLKGMEIHWDHEAGLPYLKLSHFQNPIPSTITDVAIPDFGYSHCTIVDSWTGAQPACNLSAPPPAFAPLNVVTFGVSASLTRRSEQVFLELHTEAGPFMAQSIYQLIRRNDHNEWRGYFQKVELLDVPADS